MNDFEWTDISTPDMGSIQIIDHHTVIRDTVGYDVLKEIDVIDLPEVIKFLKIVNNYIRMKNIKEDEG